MAQNVELLNLETLNSFNFNEVQNHNQEANDLAIAWINLSYYIKPLFKDYKSILNNLNGKLNFGSLTALMGPSGSGKTTLLQCINGLNWSNLSNQTKIYQSKYYKINSCFIVQNKEEHLLMNLTVYESLKYSFLIKNSKLNENHNLELTINQILTDLLMSSCANNLVRNCSGGEQKRLSIGLELTSFNKPNLICVDEPTSGLDSHSAEQVISCLKNLTLNYNIAIVTSIHQPNNDILALFDNIYVLSKNGNCIFDGDRSTLKNDLLNCGIICLEWQIPIEVIIQIASESNQITDELINQNKNNQKQIEKLCQLNGNLISGSFNKNNEIFNIKHFYYLLCRNCRYNFIRGWLFYVFLFIVNIVLVFNLLDKFPDDMGSDSDCLPDLSEFSLTELTQKVYDAIEGKRTKSLHNTLFFLSIIGNLVPVYYFAIIFTFTKEIKIFLNEHRNGWYSTSSYYLSRIFIEFPIFFLNIYLSYWLVYYGSAQPDMNYWYQGIWDIPHRFIYSFIIIELIFLNCLISGMVFGLTFPKNIKMAVIIMLIYLMFTVVTNDVIVPIDELDNLFKLLGNLYINLGIKSLLITIYGERCETESIILTFLNIEDQLLTYCYHLVIQIFLWVILGYILLSINANYNVLYKYLTNIKSKIAKYQKPNLQSYDNKVFSSSIVDHQLNINIENIVNNSENDIQIISNSANFDDKIAFGWTDLSYTKNSCRTSVNILKDLNGKINFNTLTGILGPSGAGKTTFLNCINGLLNYGLSQNTKYYVNKNSKLKPCYIYQNQKQHLLMDLTVKESLHYASKIKNSKINKSEVNHEKIVNKILDEMLLTNCENNLVGKCSGGEQKRLSIGLELTSKIMPNLFLLDEPTTGLDSYASEQLIMCLQKLTNIYEIAIVTTLHQPNNNMLMLFHQLYVLSNGKFIFYGRPVCLKEHLQQCDVICDENDVPIEKIIKLAYKNDENKKTIECMVNKTNENLSFVKEKLRNECKLSSAISSNKKEYFDCSSFLYLLQRELKQVVIRKWKYQLMIGSSFLLIIITLVLIFSNDIGTDPGCAPEHIDLKNFSSYTQQILDAITGQRQKYQINVAFLYYTFIYLCLIVIITSTINFTHDFKVFLTEHSNNWYSTGSYYLAKNIAEIPMIIIFSFIYFYIAYYFTSQSDMIHWYQGFWDVPYRFKLFIINNSLNLLILQGIIFSFCIMFPNSFRKSLVFLSAIYGTMLNFNGFYVPIQDMSPLNQLLAKPNFSRLWFESMLIIIYKDRCSSKPIVFSSYTIDENDLQTNLYYLLFSFILIRILNMFLFYFKTTFYQFNFIEFVKNLLLKQNSITD